MALERVLVIDVEDDVLQSALREVEGDSRVPVRDLGAGVRKEAAQEARRPSPQARASSPRS